MDLPISLLMLSAIALTIGAVVLWRRDGSRRQVVLMLIAAAVMAANVAIWVLPDSHGNAPVSATPR